jgi:hypothetical protein
MGFHVYKILKSKKLAQREIAAVDPIQNLSDCGIASRASLLLRG